MSSRAVFLSHASEDAPAALRIAAALRAAGIEVWLDRSELRGGDAWDHRIRSQLRDCALFIPVISRHTARRAEAYFRLEWHLADQRTQLMAPSHAFIVPVCVDDTEETAVEAPDSFLAVHWTRLPDGATPHAFCERIAALLPAPRGVEPAPAASVAGAAAPAEVLRVGSFELAPSQRRLARDGQPIELGARAFDLLCVLAEQPGRLVTKATLLERVWPKLVVDENNLPAQIASLRRVLGADAIRTVPGFGYRLELEVVQPPAAAPLAAAPPVAPAATASPPAAPAPLPVRAVAARLSPLVGRTSDLQALEEALTSARCVTVVGGAGIGKTRLAQEVLARAVASPARQAAWVDLRPLTQLRHVASAMALAVGVTVPDRGDAFAALHQALAQAPLLLILDGAEHLSSELAPALAELLARTGEVRALVTSQLPLALPGETVFRLGPLALGEPQGDALEQAGGAIVLFAQRATAADRRFALTAANLPTVAEICRRLDGNPLALELAAARIPALGAAKLLERLGDRLRLLKSSATSEDTHHSALQAAFDWSYQLLSPSEQQVFNRLGVFSGSFSLECAAECVCEAAIDACDAIDLISRLVDRSLVNALPSEPPRYALSETARLYALERLHAAGQEPVARQRMAAAMLELLDRAYTEYWSAAEGEWLARYEPDLENVRSALSWARANEPSVAVALFGSAWPLLYETELNAEGRHSYHDTVGLLSDGLPRARVGRFWEALATFESTRQCDRARYAAELAAHMHADTGELPARYYALTLLASNWRIDNEAARAAFEQARSIEDPAWPARLLGLGALAEGALLLTRGEFAAARRAYSRALSTSLMVSERQALAATAEIVELDVASGDPDAALQLARPLVHRLRHSSRSAVRFGLLVATLQALLQKGELDEARTIALEILEVGTRLEPARLYTALDAMAQLACDQGHYLAAARIAACADAAYARHGQGERRLTEAQLRAQVDACLERELGAGWRGAACDPRSPLEERGACALALGLTA